MLEVNTKPPDFTLCDKEGNLVSLSDFHGKKVVLYFYPKDNTPGCSRQACAFAKAYDEFKKDNIVVIGISKDSVASHQKFAENDNVMAQAKFAGFRELCHLNLTHYQSLDVNHPLIISK